MKYYIPKITFLCVCFAVLIAASAVKAQAIYQAEESETITASSPNGNQTVTLVLPRRAIQPAEVAIIVNRQDLQSVNVAAYYQKVRNIPAANVIEVSFPAASTSITQQDFEVIKAQVDAAVNALPDIQALVITWTEPWKVKENDSAKGMSITSAFALGFDVDYYNDTSRVCEATRETRYYNTDSVRPYSDFGLRPAMMLAGVSKQNVIDLIDRAASADQTFPGGDGYFISATDINRSTPRYKTFINTVDSFNRTDALVMNYIDNSAGVASGNYISSTPDVLFYFTGLVTVPEIDTNGYVAGAVADHLTSAGGRITGPNAQMSILRWLEAGTVASYGTVIEPCNFADKFTHTTTFVSSYFGGATVLEAYWKSVRTPGEGIFVGDPMTRPYGTRVTLGDDGSMEIFTTILKPGKTYSLLEAGSIEGPFKIVQANITVDRLSFSTITQNAGKSVYVLAEEGDKDLSSAITDDGAVQVKPRNSGTRIVWYDKRNAFFQRSADADIYFYDLTTGQEQQIASVSSSYVSELDISERHITWAGKHPDVMNQNAIYIYDIDTGQTEIIAPAGFNLPIKLRISGNFLIWLEAGTVHAYDINTGEFRMIQTAAVNPRDLDLSANRLVVEDVSGAIFIYDLMIDEEQRIPNDSGSLPSHPAISGDWVIWQQPGPEDLLGKSDIHFYDITTGERQRITFGTLALQSIPVISGKWIAWTDDRHGPDKLTLYSHNILTGEEILLEAVDAGRIKGAPSLADGRLVWSGAFEHPEDFASNKWDIFMYEFPRSVLRAGRTAEVVTDAWYFLDLLFDFISPPVLLAGIETYADSDTAGLRIRRLNNGGMEVKIEEETSADAERDHAAEVVGYITADSGPIYNFLGNIIGEAGFVTTSQGVDRWYPLDLNHSYVNPVVFMNMITTNGGNPSHIRIRNVGAGSLEYQIEEWDYLDQAHMTETLAYLVVEAGLHQMQDDRPMEVGTVDTNHGWKPVTFNQSFDSAPVTLSQCQTYNGWPAVTTRQANLSAASFQVRLQEEEGNGAGNHAIETVGYIAVEADQ